MKTCKKGLHQHEDWIKRCRECIKETRQSWRKKYEIKNYQELKEKRKKYRIKNRKRINEYKKKYYSKNIKKERKKRSLYYIKNANKIKERKLLLFYNIDLNIYNLMLKTQNYSCAICKNKAVLHKSKKYYMLCVDHNHNCCPYKKTCGKCIRGLLCDRCNRAIGSFKDSPSVLSAAAKYLKSYEKTQENITPLPKG